MVMTELSVDVNNLTRRRVNSEIIKKAAGTALKLLGKIGNFELSIVLVGSQRMRSLNLRFRGKNNPTDVLSFGFQEDSANKGNVLGEVVICLPYAEKQARELGISFRENLATLTAHGVIHLCGIDHEKSDEEYKRTLEIQQKVLKGLNYK
ncbi:MAG: rRNA maturation RNase YbeY [Patescibacteria group bacterium]